MQSYSSLPLVINPHNGVPVYRQVVSQIQYLVATGALEAGVQLPSIRELARTLAVNPSTVTKAYDELRHAGTVLMRRGKGVFIAPQGEQSPVDTTPWLQAMRAIVNEAKQAGLSAEHLQSLFDEALREQQQTQETTQGNNT